MSLKKSSVFSAVLPSGSPKGQRLPRGTCLPRLVCPCARAVLGLLELMPHCLWVNFALLVWFMLKRPWAITMAQSGLT